MPEQTSAGEAIDRCPTGCDPDCDADCHETHDVPARREHRPEDCPSRSGRREAMSEERLARIKWLIGGGDGSAIERELLAEVERLRDVEQLVEPQLAELGAERAEWKVRAERGDAVAKVLRAELDRCAGLNRDLVRDNAAATERAETAERELAEMRERVGEATVEWGVQSADSGRAQVCDDEGHARHLAERYSQFRLPGGEPVQHHVVKRMAGTWREVGGDDGQR